MDNSFSIVIPATLEKGKNGDYKIQGLASTQELDSQGEVLLQDGIDLTPIDQKKGVLNWDHKPGPENTVGLLDGYSKTPEGFFIQGRLFKNHSRAIAIKEIMQSLGKKDKGRMGLSVEGKIIQRNADKPSVIEKCQINAVALTMRPVNVSTYASLVKSLSGSELEFSDNSLISSETFEDGEPLTFEKKDKPVQVKMYTGDEVAGLLTKALGIGAGVTGPSGERSGGAALAQEELDRKVKKVYKGKEKDLHGIMNKLHGLYPETSREDLWSAVKARLKTRFGV